MESNAGRDPYFIQSVAHAADVLRAFTTPSEVLRLREVVSRTSHNKGIAFRMLYTLEKTGLVEKVGANQYRSTVQPRKARKYKIGYGAQGTNYQFGQQVTDSLKQEADRLETVELLVLCNRYNPKVSQRNADLFVKERCDLVIEFQTDENVAPIISAKFRNAKIPLIALEIPHPGATYFGANNYEAGLIGGRELGRWARQHWGGQVEKIVMLELPRAGMIPRAPYRHAGRHAGGASGTRRMSRCLSRRRRTIRYQLEGHAQVPEGDGEEARPDRRDQRHQRARRSARLPGSRARGGLRHHGPERLAGRPRRNPPRLAAHRFRGVFSGKVRQRVDETRSRYSQL
jgi:hypothetical protein